MSTFRRLFDTAQKALDEKSSGTSRSGQSSDWRSLVRSAADTLTGDGSAATGGRQGRAEPRHRTAAAQHAEPGPRTTSSQGPASAPAPAADLSVEDRRAIARYDYLVRTAEPDQLERVHREAFEALTPSQRAQLSSRLGEELPAGERPRSDAPQDLARSATRLGALDPRRLTSLLGRSDRGRRGRGAGALGGAALGAGALGAGGLLAAVAGGAVVTSVGGALLQDALGAGIDIDALTPELVGDLGGIADGFGEFESIEGLGGITDGVGGGISDAGERVSGLGDQISDLGLGDLFGR